MSEDSRRGSARIIGGKYRNIGKGATAVHIETESGNIEVIGPDMADIRGNGIVLKQAKGRQAEEPKNSDSRARRDWHDRAGGKIVIGVTVALVAAAALGATAMIWRLW